MLNFIFNRKYRKAMKEVDSHIENYKYLLASYKTIIEDDGLVESKDIYKERYNEYLIRINTLTNLRDSLKRHIS